MVSPSEKLAQSLEKLQKLQDEGKIAIRSNALSRIHRERLVKNGFLSEVMKGWYIPTRPDQAAGESTAWYASFWDFCADYLSDRFGSDWCLSAEQSLNHHVGDRTVPPQLIVRSSKGSNNITHLPQNTSILDLNAALPPKSNLEKKEQLNLMRLPAALISCSPTYFRNSSTNARAALATISDASELLPLLLEGGHTIVAGRLAGGFRHIGRDRIADDILKTMKGADFDCREGNPFADLASISFVRTGRSPYVNRIELIWNDMREPILKIFPKPPGLPGDLDRYLEQVQELYVTDAYHSLSIEGYKVSRELIDKVRLGNWNPESDKRDREHREALAARGYWQAYQAVRKSLLRVLTGENAGLVADQEHGDWFRELFAPSVAAGILRPADLAGYRSGQVYIRHSMHVPPGAEAVRDMMPTFLELMQDETEPVVRVVLGHFVLVYIHPYMDGNGRTGRFMMNLMLGSGGYPWTVIPVERRADYLRSLESASVKQDIVPFANFLAELVQKSIEGKPEAE
ncbi:MAG: Fic family protein [Candidatus Obscuribacterales bacterium]